MNYLKLIKGFWKMHRQLPFTGNECLMYVSMVNLFSDQGEYDEWPEEIRKQDGLLAGTVGVSINTMKDARTGLESRGLLTYVEIGRGSRGGAVYSLIEHYDPAKRSSKSDDLTPRQKVKKKAPKRSVSDQKPPEKSSNSDELPLSKSSKIDEVPSLSSSKIDEQNAKDHQQVHQNIHQNLTNSIYIVSKPSNPQTKISLSQKKGEMQNLENQKPPAPVAPTNPRSAAPLPSPTEEEEFAADDTAREAFTKKLQTNRHLLLSLTKVLLLTDEKERNEWIEAFVISKWADPTLKTRRQHDIISYCQSWINQERSKPTNFNGQRKNASGANGQYRGTGRSTRKAAYIPNDALGDIGQKGGNDDQAG